MKIKQVFAAAILGVLFQGLAFAQSFYLGAEGGFVFFKDEADDIANLYVHGSGFDSARVKQDGTGFAVRPFVGLEITKNIAAELGLMAFSQNTTVTFTDSGDSYKDTYDASWSTVDFSLLLRPGADSKAHGFFARIGGHSTKATVDFKSSWDGSDISYSESKSGALFGLGYDWFFGESKAHHALRLSFTHYSDFIVGLEDEALNILRLGYFYRF
jgi:hypothetical protein